MLLLPHAWVYIYAAGKKKLRTKHLVQSLLFTHLPEDPFVFFKTEKRDFWKDLGVQLPNKTLRRTAKTLFAVITGEKLHLGSD